MNNYKCPKCGSASTRQLGWTVYQCNPCENLWIDEKRHREEFIARAEGAASAISNHVWAFEGKYGSHMASVGTPTLGSTPIGKLSGIPGDDIVRDHRGSSVGRVKDVGNYKVLEWGWWLP